MKQTIRLDENDYLSKFLYAAAKSEVIKKRKRNSWIVVTCSFFALSLLFYHSHNNSLCTYFLITGTVALVLYPTYQDWFYKRHYARYVKTKYSECIGKECEIELDAEYLYARDLTGESKVATSQIDAIIETADYIFIKIKPDNVLILPKRELSPVFFEHIQEIAGQLNIKTDKNLSWK